ncbi:hypothetical protein BDN71DRAFT_1432686 [Pleurotus eryngii]|uniref:Uncharacterized protein n=1 Tax=Pleurotus eryngii TaxID=5323 RepID=A0A9P5ZSM9_PLEER|nr:hypothetical protein BDN71DRAFT_1432686 [Pleurotus eryngii]
MTITKIGPPRDAAKANKMKEAQGGSKTVIMNSALQEKKTQADKTDGPEASAQDAKGSNANDSKMPAGSPTPAPSRAGSPVPSKTVAIDLAAISACLGSISPSANSINPPAPLHLDDSNVTPIDVSWPDLFRVLYLDMFALQSMPTKWFQLLSLLSHLEVQSNFKKSSVFLSTLYCLAEISVWVGRGCSLWPVIADIDVFGNTWWCWWIAMQPEWQRWNAKVCKVPDAWVALDRPDPNSFMNLIYSLEQWGEARASALQKPNQPLPDWTLLSEDGHDWLTSVADVMWAIECLMASHNAGDLE